MTTTNQWLLICLCVVLSIIVGWLLLPPPLLEATCKTATRVDQQCLYWAPPEFWSQGCGYGRGA